MKELINKMLYSNDKVREFLEEIKTLQYEEIYLDNIIDLQAKKAQKQALESKIIQFYQVQSIYEKAIMEIIFEDNCIVFREE